MWKRAKPFVQGIVDSSDCVVLGVNETIQAKPYSTDNELNCWHYDHTKIRAVKGINLLSAKS